MEPITLAALGVGAYLLLTQNKPAGVALTPVTGRKTGKSWLSRVTSVTGSGDDKRVTVEVYAPPPATGGAPRLVATYVQAGSDKAARTLIAAGPGAPAALVAEAKSDFGFK